MSTSNKSRNNKSLASSSHPIKPLPLPLTVSSKPSPMIALFRREVTTFLSTPPSPHLLGKKVTILASIERISSNNLQQSVQLCSAGDETWVTRTEGQRDHFPRVGRVQKRVRNDDDDEEDNEVKDMIAEENEDDEEGDYEDEAITPVKNRKGKSYDSKKTPIIVGSGSSKKSRSSIPKAPRKIRQPPSSASDNIQRRHSSPAPPSNSSIADTFSEETLMRQNVREALGRGGKRRCSNKESTIESESGKGEDVVKREEDLDDLASLCGGVHGLDVKSSLDAGMLHHFVEST